MLSVRFSGVLLHLAGVLARRPVASAQGPLPPPPDLSDDAAAWPNTASYRNSDEWIWQNHEKIRVMRPRVVVLNFANDVDDAGIREHSDTLVKAWAEATRYHGYADAAAPAFIQYQVVRRVESAGRPGGGVRDGAGGAKAQDQLEDAREEGRAPGRAQARLRGTVLGRVRPEPGLSRPPHARAFPESQ